MTGTDHRLASDGDIALVDLVTILLRQRRLLVTIPAVLFAIVVVVTLMQPRTYSTVGSFVPNATQGRSSQAIGGLAAQFGVVLPATSVGQSPDFYAELLRSREIAGGVVDHMYEFVALSGLPFFRDTTVRRGTLIEVLEIEDASPAKSREKAMVALANMISVSTSRLSGTVKVTVTTPWPALSQQLAERMLELVDEFNRTRRQSQATTERSFIDERVVAAGQELRDAENTLQQFLQRNRTFRESPQLVFEHARLEREVGMRQQVYTALVQAHEQARIDEVRNTPVITVVQQPELPALPDRRRLVLKGLIALVVGAGLGVVAAFGRENLLSGNPGTANSRAQFEALKEQTVSDLRRPWRLLRAPASQPQEGPPR